MKAVYELKENNSRSISCEKDGKSTKKAFNKKE